MVFMNNIVQYFVSKFQGQNSPLHTKNVVSPVVSSSTPSHDGMSSQEGPLPECVNVNPTQVMSARHAVSHSSVESASTLLVTG